MKRTHLLIICMAICAGYLVAGLFPFKLRVRNNLGWQPGREGTFFGSLSSVYSERRLDPVKSSSPSGPAGAFSIELYLTSEHEPRGDIGTILSIYDGDLPANLLIAQRKSELLLRRPARNARGHRTLREVGVSADLSPGTRRFTVITSGAGGTDFYVDGTLIKAFPDVFPGPEDLSGRLILGDAPEGHSHWAGKLIGVAIFSRALSAQEVRRHYGLWTAKRLQDIGADPGLAALYNFGERSGRTIPDRSASQNPLQIPEYYRTFRRDVLVLPGRDPNPNFSDMADVVINIVGFVPLGFFYFFYRNRVRPQRALRNLGLTLIVSGITSMAIELAQVYLPARYSSLSDLLCNMAGGLVGALLAAGCLSLARKRAARPPNPDEG